MNHDEWLEQAGKYALGVLNGEELTQFEAHLTLGCQACEDHMQLMWEILSLLPWALALPSPPSRIKARLLARTMAEERKLGREAGEDLTEQRERRESEET